MPPKLHCLSCAKKGIDCVAQTKSKRKTACADCAAGNNRCQPIPRFCHLAYAAWTRSNDDAAESATTEIRKLARSIDVFARAKKNGLLPRAMYAQLESLCDEIRAMEQAGTRTPAFQLGSRRFNPVSRRRSTRSSRVIQVSPTPSLSREESSAAFSTDSEPTECSEMKEYIVID